MLKISGIQKEAILTYSQDLISKKIKKEEKAQRNLFNTAVFGSEDFKAKEEKNEAYQRILRISQQEKPSQNEHEIFSQILPISVSIFWNRVLSDNAKYSCLQFYADEGHKNIELDKWNSDIKNGRSSIKDMKQIDNITDSKIWKLNRTLSMKIKVKGFPLISSIK